MNALSRSDLLWSGLLVGAVVMTALALVYVKHLQRQATTQLENLEQARAALNIEWSRLQLEESAIATPGRVERVARERIGMRLPAGEDVRVLEP